MHYLVLVITNDDPEELLRPFDEGLGDEPHVIYTHDELVEHMAKLAKQNPNIKELQTDPMTAAEYWFGQYNSDFIKDGEVWTTYNKNAKWDWWVYGGRFADAFDDYYDWDADQAEFRESEDFAYRVKYIKPTFIPAAVLTPDGEWHEPGPMGWFSINATEEEQKKFYDECYERYIKPYIGCRCYLIDCHI